MQCGADTAAHDAKLVGSTPPCHKYSPRQKSLVSALSLSGTCLRVSASGCTLIRHVRHWCRFDSNRLGIRTAGKAQRSPAPKCACFQSRMYNWMLPLPFWTFRNTSDSDGSWNRLKYYYISYSATPINYVRASQHITFLSNFFYTIRRILIF